MTHEMQLAKEPFNKVRNGTKTIESRLYDEKRREIGLGDEIVFRLTGSPHETLTKRVVSIHLYRTFRDMMSDLPAERFGWSDTEEAAAEIVRFYSEEDQMKNGVIGIGLA